MIKLSFWARRHPALARFFIVALHLLSIVNALFLGVLLYRGDWPASPVLTSVLALTFLTAGLLYPKRKGRSTSKTYWRQKRCDFTLVFSGALMIACSVNHYLATPLNTSLALDNSPERTILLAALGQPSPGEVAPPRTKAELRRARKSQVREFRASIKAWKQANKGNRKESKFGQIMLIILVVMGAALASLLVAGLACSISCSGAEGLGILVLLAGLTGIVFLSVVLIRKILGAGGPPARPS